ncbi:MAG: hypothetical protein HOV81_44980 [Kofleriaceae bacterium]|nr:hypothetical protein [Kofleriaceae bacterium]
MGYDIGWAIVGEQPLARDELVDLKAHVAKWAKRIVGYDLLVATSVHPQIQAHFMLRPQRAKDAVYDEHYDGDGAGGFAFDVIDTIWDAMEKLRAIVPRHEVLVQDDFFGYRWDGRKFDTTKLDLEWPSWDAEGWIALGTLALPALQERFADRPTGLRPAPAVKPRKKRQRNPYLGPLGWDEDGGERFVGPWAWPPAPEPERPFFERLDEAQAVARESLANETALVSPVAAYELNNPVAGDIEKVLDELVHLAVNEVTNISDEDRARLGLDLPRSPDRWTVREAIAKCLATRWPEQATALFLDRAGEWISSMVVADLTRVVFAAVTPTSVLQARVVDVWQRFIVDPDKSRYVTDYLRPLLPLAFDAALEALRAPLPALERDLGQEAIKTLAFSGPRAADGLSVLVACIRRDRRHPLWERLREWTLAAFDRLETVRGGVPSVLIEIASGEVRMSSVYRVVARDPERGLEFLDRLRDCTGLAEYSVDLLDAFPDHVAYEAKAVQLLSHPFWRVRMWAISRVHYAMREGAAAAVWATFVDSDVDVEDRDRERFVSGKGPYDRKGWLAEAARHGVAELPALPTAVEGLSSRCPDHRSWAIGFVDKRRRVADAATLVLADELDLALSHRGHARAAIAWARWRVLIDDLPVDLAGRSAWARERLDGVPAELRAVAERGAETVALEYPPGRFALSAAELDVLDRLEQDIASRGEELLAR